MRPKTYQLNYLNDICGKDAACQKEIVKTFIFYIVKDLKELQKSHSLKNKQQVYSWIHKIKSSVKIFSEEIGAIAEEIETLTKHQEEYDVSKLLLLLTEKINALTDELKKDFQIKSN